MKNPVADCMIICIDPNNICKELPSMKMQETFVLKLKKTIWPQLIKINQYYPDACTVNFECMLRDVSETACYNLLLPLVSGEYQKHEIVKLIIHII
jgi:hypothetical protein